MAPRLCFPVTLALMVGVFLSCSKKKDGPTEPPSTPPAPSGLQVVGTGNDWLRLIWHLSSADEDGFYVYWQVDSTWQVRDTVAASQTETVYHNVIGLQPATTYRFRVTAFNDAGESAPSNEYEAQTGGTLPPSPPINIQATVLSPSIVQVQWTPVGTADGFQIRRHEPGDPWMLVGSTGPSGTSYIDSFAAPVTPYYYSVGSVRGNLAPVWSIDSAFVQTPDGPPIRPDSVLAESFPGVGLRITWADRSENEAGFTLSRSHNGGAFVPIDSLAANVTSYFDSLAEITGNYTYCVRSYNPVGTSLCAYSTTVHYELCSGGVIPLCVGNWWHYQVTDSAGADYDFQRTVAGYRMIGGLDYYLLTQNPLPDGPQDSLYYLRNFNDGCRMIHHPLTDSTAQMLYKYPAGTWYRVDGDCVIVAAGLTITVGNVCTPCTGVYAYQRFYSGTHSVQIYAKPQTIGIIREDEYVNSTRVARRDLTGYSVQNQ